MITTLLLAVSLTANQARPLPEMPSNLPSWLKSKGSDRLYRQSAPHNFKIHLIPSFERDMTATGVGHAMAYEAMARGEDDLLESQVFNKISWVLNHPPRNPVDEGSISPTFLREFGSLEKVFDWAHLLHFQTIDALIGPSDGSAVDQSRVDAEIERLWTRYAAEPYAITGLPMNMDVQDGFAYSGEFRRRHPKVNGLFWGYHWLQTINYDMLYQTPLREQRRQYDVIGDQYHSVELGRVDRDFMPMTAELSPRFAKRFPEIANAFDNLHMLHDNVNDILASPELSDAQKRSQVDIAIYRVLASTHARESAGTGAPGTLHDHRHPPSMAGMGLMPGSEGDTMFMPGMGWMDMSSCAHCSIPLPDVEPWGATVTANGWTMMVRCVMCARDMASETPGRAIIRSSTEDPARLLVMISDEEGNWTSSIPDAVFLEKVEEHPECMDWSRAFTSKDAFHRYVAGEPMFKDERPLDLESWSKLNHGTPHTFQKIDRPNPYRGRM